MLTDKETLEALNEINRKKIAKQKMGKKSRRKGKEFELSVRHDLEAKGWTVTKWSNQLQTISTASGVYEFKMVQAKSKFNPFLKRVMNEGSGFPDFIAFKIGLNEAVQPFKYEIWGIEAKKGKYLDAEEKQKVEWYKQNKIFSRIWKAFEGSEDEIVYQEL